MRQTQEELEGRNNERKKKNTKKEGGGHLIEKGEKNS
jgi:hypothetical protein